jgi:phosphatidylserine decarboxylase
MISRYGYDVFFTISIICFLLVVVSLLFIEPRIVRYGLITLSALVLVFTINFFRDPERATPPGDKLIIAPADGKVIMVKDVIEPEYLKSRATMVSIFMSPLDVHVNRNPITGTVGYFRYIQGEYFAAFEEKASEKNEQTVIGLENGHGKILFKQIAGFVARRIVCTLHSGDQVRAGDRFGMIKFGSRVDVFVPETAVVRVTVGERTIAGETVLAEFQ